jgi:hypothetical protein
MAPLALTVDTSALSAQTIAGMAGGLDDKVVISWLDLIFRYVRKDGQPVGQTWQIIFTGKAMTMWEVVIDFLRFEYEDFFLLLQSRIAPKQ